MCYNCIKPNYPDNEIEYREYDLLEEVHLMDLMTPDFKPDPVKYRAAIDKAFGPEWEGHFIDLRLVGGYRVIPNDIH